VQLVHENYQFIGLGSLSATPCAKQNAGPERNFLILRQLRD
jgi:hypothetical protein